MQVFLNQLVYFGFLQSLFLLFVYLVSPKNSENVNGYIVFFIIILTVGLSSRVAYLSGIVENNYRWVVFSEFATLMFGPTVYLFTKSSLYGERFKVQYLYHYLPAVVYNAFVVMFFIWPSDEELQARTDSGEQLRNVMLFVGVGLVYNVTYWYRSVRLFRKFKTKLESEISYVVQSRFFNNFLIAVGGCLLCWFTMYLLSLAGIQLLNKLAWQTVWMSLALIILFIAFYVLRSPELFKIAELSKVKKYSNSRLSHSDLEQLELRLKELMVEKKPYLNAKLLKAELAEMLEVSSPEVARLLNERIGMNFFEYVNYYRVKEFVELAKSEKYTHLTMFGLAQEAGFNSKTTFNKSFKSLMGKSPSEYFKNQTS